MLSQTNLHHLRAYRNSFPDNKSVYFRDPVNIVNFEKVLVWKKVLLCELTNTVKGTPWAENFSMLKILKIYFIWSYISYPIISAALNTCPIGVWTRWSGGGGPPTAPMVCSTLGRRNQLLAQCCASIQPSFRSIPWHVWVNAGLL